MQKQWMRRLTHSMNNHHAKNRMVYCPVTQLVLYTVSRAGDREVKNSYGTCPQCNQDIHISELHTSMTKPSYPIELTGVWCNRCWENPVVFEFEDDDTF